MSKILLIHNFYQQPGGEDTIFSSEVSFLREHGHEVIEYTDHNNRIPSMNVASVAIQTLWSQPAYIKILELLKAQKPDIAHFHNIFPLISPSAYYACQKVGVPVLQSLDNPRLICPSATFYRNNGLCLDCLGRTPPWPGIIHRCYHHSWIHTGVVAAMLTYHRLIRTWEKQVNLFLIATEFYKNIFIRAGLPKDKLVIKPHFVKSFGDYVEKKEPGKYALYLARLDPEKGIQTILSAWIGLKVSLKIRGDGQLEQETREFIQDNSLDFVELIGRLARDELFKLIEGARFLVWPSHGFYETFGLAAVECYAAGVPVIASRIGVMTEIVIEGETGLFFNPGDADDLADKVRWLWNHPDEALRMGKRARQVYEEKYSPEKNYRMLMDIYQKALANRK